MTATATPPATATAAPIFIVGYMHSGTSMLQHALGSHSAIFATVGETKYFDFLPMTRTKFPDLASDATFRALVEHCVRSVFGGYSVRDGRLPTEMPDAAEIDALAAAISTRDHAGVFGLVMDHLARRAGKTRWLEKTPTHIFVTDVIARAVPGARFVEIVRDPRDVLASKKTRRETVWTTKRYTEGERAWKHLEKAYDPLWDALSWKAAARSGFATARRQPDQHLRVRYEDLVAAPERELRRVCAFVDLPFEAAMLDVPAGQPASEQSIGTRTRGISTDSLGRWRTTLSPAEAAVIQRITADELAALDYPRDAISLRTDLRAVPVLAHSAGELFVRLRRRQQLGGTKFLTLTLGNYLRRARRLISG